MYEEGKVDVERGVYDTNNQLKRETFKYDQEGHFFLVWLSFKVKKMLK